MKQKLKICTHHLRIEDKSLYNPQKNPKDEKVPVVDVSSLKWKKRTTMINEKEKCIEGYS